MDTKRGLLTVWCFVTLLLFSNGCLTNVVDKVSWLEPKLELPNRLILPFVGKASGAYTITVVSQSEEEGPFTLQYHLLLKEALQVTKERWHYPLEMERPIRSKATVKITRVGSTESSVYAINGVDCIEEIVTPLDKLSGRELESFLKKIGQIRRVYTEQSEQDMFAAVQTAQRSMLSTLDDLDIDETKLGRIKKLVRQLKSLRIKPGSELAQRLLPFRFAEAILAEKGYLLPPWGYIDEEMGFRFFHTLYAPKSSQWNTIGRIDFIKEVPHKVLPGKRVEQWCWLASKKLLEQVANKDRTVSFLYGNVIGSTTSDVPPPSSYKPFVEFELDSSKEYQGKWPPQGARIDLALKVFAREAILRLTINEKSTAVITNTAFFAIGKPDFRPYDFTRVSIPLSPKILIRGKNKINLTVDTIPFHEPPLPVRVRSVSLRISNDKEAK